MYYCRAVVVEKYTFFYSPILILLLLAVHLHTHTVVGVFKEWRRMNGVAAAAVVAAVGIVAAAGVTDVWEIKL